MKKHFTLSIAAVMMLLASCTKEVSDQTSLSDATLGSMSSSDGMVRMRTVKSDGGEWHIKMNAVAMLAEKEGREYPLNSMIVKEKVDAHGEVVSNQSMYRTNGDPDSDNGWVYSESTPDGHVIIGAAQKGATCKSCHAQSSKALQH